MKAMWMLALFAGLGVPAAAAQDKAALALVDRAVAAMGGADRLAAIRTLTIRGQNRHWEPQQSPVAGADNRPGGQSTFTISSDLARGATRIDWVRNLTAPGTRTYTFSEVVTAAGGFVEGIDTTARTKQSLENQPPRHAMSSQRVAAILRELKRASPVLLIEMKRNPGALGLAPVIFESGKRLPAVRYVAGGQTFTVAFDPESGLPARVRTVDADSMWGDANYDLALSDWREVGGVKVAFHQLYTLNDRLIIHQTYDEVAVNPALSAGLFDVPEALRATLNPPATSNVAYQWVIRRMLWGTFMDSDAIAFDLRARPSLSLVDIAPGVSHMTGGSHNSLVVEMKDHLIVFDAPIGEIQSLQTIEAAKKRYPGKPIRYLALTHHHMDHASGSRTFVAEGAKVVVGAGNGAYMRQMFESPARVANDRLARSPRKAEIVEVADKLVLSDGARSVELFNIENTHAAGMLIGYIPDAKLGFVTDIWSPGRDPIGPNQGQRELYQAVRKIGIAPERFAGGHGSVQAFKELAEKMAAAK